MPKNINGGNKAKKGKNNPTIVQKEIVYADKSGFQYYAVIEKFMGHSAKLIMQRVDKQEDGSIKYVLIPIDGLVRGKIMKKCKPKSGDVVLVCTRDFSTKFVDIIHKYTEDNIKDLKKNKEFIDEFSKQIDTFCSIDSKSNSKKQQEDEGNIYFDDDYKPQERCYELSEDEEEEEEESE